MDDTYRVQQLEKKLDELTHSIQEHQKEDREKSKMCSTMEGTFAILQERMTNLTNTVQTYSNASIEMKKDLSQSLADLRQDITRELSKITVDNMDQEKQQRDTISRTHARIDDIYKLIDNIDKAGTKSLESLSKEIHLIIDTNVKTLQKQCEESGRDTQKKHEELAHTVNVFEKEYSSRMSFVRGIMWVLGGVIIVFQGIGLKFYNDLVSSVNTASGGVSTINNRVDEMDRQLERITSAISALGKK